MTDLLNKRCVALQTLLDDAERENDELRIALRGIFSWAKCWDSPFLEDGSWIAHDEPIVKALLEKDNGQQ